MGERKIPPKEVGIFLIISILLQLKLHLLRKRALLRRMKSIYYGTIDIEDSKVNSWLGLVH